MNNDSNFNRFSILDTDDTEIINNIDTKCDTVKEKNKKIQIFPKNDTSHQSYINEDDTEHYSRNKFKYGFKRQFTQKKYNHQHQEGASIDDIKIDKNNIKKMLCFNMLNKKGCNYGNKCMYAHNLEEQKKEPLREVAYDIILNKNDLSNIDLLTDRDLYHSLIQLTRTCMYCNKGVCTGGYNCKYGVIKSSYQICYDDLLDGKCQRSSCPYVHLTRRGLVPYSKQKLNKKLENDTNKQLYSSVVQGGVNMSNSHKESIFQNSDKNKDNTTEVPLGTLLSDTFFSKKKKDDGYDSDLDQSEDSVKKIKNYLNQESDDSCEESIFSIENDMLDIIPPLSVNGNDGKKN